MELLKIAANGQWTLEKQSPSPEYKTSPDNNYLSYNRHTAEGRLPVDYGRKGSVHNSSNTRPPRTVSPDKMKGKIPTPTSSARDDNNPGVGA